MALEFHTDGTGVSYGWNWSFIWVELEFHTGGTGVPMGVGTRVSYRWHWSFIQVRRRKRQPRLCETDASYCASAVPSDHVGDLPGEGSQTLLGVV